MESHSLRDLYPSLNDEELRIAAENLDRYLQIAWDIIQREEAVRSARTGLDRAGIPGQDAKAGKVEQTEQ